MPPGGGGGNILGDLAAEHGVDPAYVVDRARAAGFEIEGQPADPRGRARRLFEETPLAVLELLNPATGAVKNDPLAGHVPAVDEAATARLVEAGVFTDAFERAFDGSPFTNHVSHYSEGELAGMPTLLTTDSLTGVAIHDHGDGRVEATALFSAPGTTKGAGLALLRRAVAEHGVNYVECFGPKLPELYKMLGFEVDGDFPFDEEQAPSGWDFDRFGRPHYYTMRLPGKLGERKAADAGEVATMWTPFPTEDEIDEVLDAAVPDGMGDADAQRDAALAVIGGLPADDGE